eukprot:CAMPEP_0204091480 /NCGR_PEP_ID=MMETSP0360-20130528/189425_1 /ASSEMBLY_ACC=CAM_ASM_000342 /TAXON_ID=268821 /ORGANISM="Scrippsiella Hangoei, Strain SHTV-5" /LENGTH=256 /DNA_ID=CAMNT_0051040745 /DNA_START=75 /DNA_END=841 /DNA_ORIENTATION=+
MSSADNGEVPLGPKPTKAYRNSSFLNSHDARLIRIMCELQEPQQRLEAAGVDNIVMFFGSARAKPKAQYEEAVKEAEAKAAKDPSDKVASAALQRLNKQAFLVPMFEVTTQLAEKLTRWSQAREAEHKAKYVVGTGAGPGMMEERLEAAGVDNIVMFFGSARAKPKAQYEEAVKEAEAKAAKDPSDQVASAALQRLNKQAFLVPMFEVTTQLAEKLTRWSQAREAEQKPKYVVGTGAGPGMMEAANEGAYRANGQS